jgi:hypothetical protein
MSNHWIFIFNRIFIRIFMAFSGLRLLTCHCLPVPLADAPDEPLGHLLHGRSIRWWAISSTPSTFLDAFPGGFLPELSGLLLGGTTQLTITAAAFLFTDLARELLAQGC